MIVLTFERSINNKKLKYYSNIPIYYKKYLHEILTLIKFEHSLHGYYIFVVYRHFRKDAYNINCKYLIFK